MLLLQVTLAVKILLTLSLWSLPLLLKPRLVLPNGTPSGHVIVRGLGASNLALLVMYAFGLATTLHGVVPWYAIGAGLVSNGLGFAFATHGLRNARDPRERTINRFNALMLGGITAGLATSAALLC
ncbi:MAG: hypothetical protein ACRBN8_29085 [Nannocystales bacterium]